MGTRKVVLTGTSILMVLVSLAVIGTAVYWRLRLDALIDQATTFVAVAGAVPTTRPAYLDPGDHAHTFAERAQRATEALVTLEKAGATEGAAWDAARDALLQAPRADRRGDPDLFGLVGAGTLTYRSHAAARWQQHVTAGRTEAALTTCLDFLAWLREHASEGIEPLRFDPVAGRAIWRTSLLDDCVLTVAAAPTDQLLRLPSALAAMRQGFLPRDWPDTHLAAVIATNTLIDIAMSPARIRLPDAIKSRFGLTRRLPGADFRLTDLRRTFGYLRSGDAGVARAGSVSASEARSPNRAALEIFAAAVALRTSGDDPDAWRHHPALAGGPLVSVQAHREGPGLRLRSEGISAVLPPRLPASAPAQLVAAREAAERWRPAGPDAHEASQRREVQAVTIRLGYEYLRPSAPHDPSLIAERDDRWSFVERVAVTADGFAVELVLPLHPPPAPTPEVDARPAGAARP